MREKLIELLEGAESAIYWDSSDKCFIEKIADHLISNGVIVLPCKLGDTVYIIRECSCYGGFDYSKGKYRCVNSKTPLGKKRRKHYCGYVAEAKFELKHLADFGKKVFLTQEDAKAELEKMAGGADNGS